MLYVLSNLLDFMPNLLNYLSKMYSYSWTKQTKLIQYLLNDSFKISFSPTKYSLSGPAGSQGSHFLETCLGQSKYWKICKSNHWFKSNHNLYFIFVYGLFQGALLKKKVLLNVWNDAFGWNVGSLGYTVF